MTDINLVFVLVLAIGFGISIVLAIRVLSNPSSFGRTSLMVSTISVAIWTFGYAMEMVSASLDEKLFWAKVQYLGISFTAPGIFCFTLEYTGHGNWLTPTKVMALSLIPVITIGMAFANNYFGLLWPNVTYVPGVSVSPLNLGHGPAFYLILIYSYALLVATTIYLVRMVTKVGRLYRSQVIVMLIGMSMPWAGNLIYVSKSLPLSGLDLTPIMLTITNLTFLIGFLRVRFLDIIPVAQDTVFRSMTEAVVVLDEKKRILELNPAAQNIFAQNDSLIGTQINSLFPDWENFRENPENHTVEINLAGREFSLRIDPIQNKNRKVHGYLVILNDITERNQYEARLKDAHAQAVEANRIKTQLLANVSHDLRTPLNAIMGYAEMLRENTFGELNLEQINATSEILDSSNKLLIFINNFIGQAQIETGHVIIRPRLFSPQDLAADVQSMVKFWAYKKGLSLSFTIDEQLPEKITGDQYWLKQVLLNLVNNALKFTEKGEVAILFSDLNHESWSIQVRDTGVGIPREAQNRIFEAFQQVENTHTNKPGGSGLGLSIVGQLVALMNGQISLESQEGIGSTFTITFPLDQSWPSDQTPASS